MFEADRVGGGGVECRDGASEAQDVQGRFLFLRIWSALKVALSEYLPDARSWREEALHEDDEDGDEGVHEHHRQDWALADAEYGEIHRSLSLFHEGHAGHGDHDGHDGHDGYDGHDGGEPVVAGYYVGRLFYYGTAESQLLPV